MENSRDFAETYQTNLHDRIFAGLGGSPYRVDAEGVAMQLTQEFGRGWSKRQLDYCVRFAEVYQNLEIVHTLCAQLSWSHIRQLVYIEDELKRDFYHQMCPLEGWSVRQLSEREP